MNKKEVVQLFRFLKSVYPQFEVDQFKIDTWTSLLADQNPARVMKIAERHALDQKFPPTISELREKKQNYDTDILKQIEEWEKAASRSATREQ